MRPRTFRLDWPLLLLAAAVVAPVYWPSLRFDLYQDDYILLRPWPPDHLASVFTGPWFDADTPDYFRPFAIYLYKALFFVFGLNTQALHVVPLVLTATVAWLLGRFVYRETGSWRLAAAGTALYAMHPTPAGAYGPWIVNQYQGLISAMTVLALLWWQRCRDKTWPSWLPLIIPIVIAAYTKETGMVVALVIPLVHAARWKWLGDVPRPRTALFVAATLVFAALNLWRMAALGGLGFGLGDLSPATTPALYWESVYTALVEPLWLGAKLPKRTLMLATLGLAGAAALALWKRTPRAAPLALTGAIVLALASLPTSLIFSHDRLSPHGVGTVLLLVAGLAAIAPHVRGTRRTVAAIAASAAAVAAIVMLTRQSIARFEPCNSNTVRNPNLLFDEVRKPPPEMVYWLRALGAGGCSNTTHTPFYRATSTITWGVTETDRDDADRRYTWHRPRVVALLDRRALAVAIELRLTDPYAADGGIVIRANDSRRSEIRLEGHEWTRVVMLLSPTFLTWTRQMHRLELTTVDGSLPGVEMRPLEVLY